MDRCAECGFAYRDLPRHLIADAVPMVAAQYRPRLGGSRLHIRPAPHTWAPVEYAAHVRDVLLVQRERIALALRFDRPTFATMDPERRAVMEHYAEQDPARVIDQLEAAATNLASLLGELSDTEWERVGVYNWPEPAERDVAWIGRHSVHELAHHLLDITRATDSAAGPASG